MGKKHNKKDKFQDQVKGNEASGTGAKSTAMGVVFGIFIAAAVGLILLGGGDGRFETVKAEAGAVKIPVAEVNDGQAHFYTFNDGGKAINFFVLRSSDGVLRAAFDSCDVCYAARKGYRQEGDTMVCNNCGQQFPSTRINEIKGGCNPAPLARSVEGDHLVLKTSDILKGGFYF